MSPGIQQFFVSIAKDRLATSKYGRVLRYRALFASALAAPIYAAYALFHHNINNAPSISAASTAAFVLAVGALCLLRISRSDTLPGHCFTLSLATQVFGEMIFSGGLHAPATALSLLIVPAAIVTAGGAAVNPWALITIGTLATTFLFDSNGMLPPSEVGLLTLQFDYLFSLSAGILLSAALVLLFERQAANAINKLSKERASFRHRALHDALTEMPNRTFFYEYAEESIAAAKSALDSRLLFFFDIDEFKQVNDQHGHAAGDALLVAYAARLNARVRSGDLAARLAGDEFAMITAAPSDQAALDHLLRRLNSITHEPFEINGQALEVGMSVGYARFPDDGDDLESLLRIADSRMYADKMARHGRGNAAPPDNVIPISSQLATGSGSGQR